MSSIHHPSSQYDEVKLRSFQLLKTMMVHGFKRAIRHVLAVYQYVSFKVRLKLTCIGCNRPEDNHEATGRHSGKVGREYFPVAHIHACAVVDEVAGLATSDGYHVFDWIWNIIRLTQGTLITLICELPQDEQQHTLCYPVGHPLSINLVNISHQQESVAYYCDAVIIVLCNER